MTTVLSLCVLAIIALCFFNIKLGLAVYIGWYLLVPFNQVQFGGFGLGVNFVNTLLLIAFLFNRRKFHSRWIAGAKNVIQRKNKLETLLFLILRGQVTWRFSVFVPFLFYYGIFFVIIFFQNETPLGWQLNYWRQNMMQTILLPIYVWHVMQWDASSIKLYRKTLFVVIILSAVYGIALMPLHGLNPYIMYIQMLKGEEYQIGYALAEGSGRLFGRISSCFTHPMAYGLFLGLSFIFVFSYRKKISNVLFFVMILLLSVNVVACGVRSSLGALGVAMCFFLIFKGEVKLILRIFGLLGLLIIMQIPELSDYVTSIVDFNQKHTQVGGSSFEMRLNQMEGCLNEISRSPFLGKGFGWHLYYIEKFGDHPILLAFESLIFVVLCDNGFMGVLIWLVFIGAIIYNTKKIVKRDCSVLYSSLLFYVIYCCLTGEYNYLRLFLLFYVIMVSENLLATNIQKVKKLDEGSLV